MSKISVDYETLETAKRKVQNGAAMSTSITRKIQGVSSSIDSRVRSRCGISSLVSIFNEITTKLSEFHTNLDTTIHYLHELENSMDYDYYMHISGLLKNTMGYNGKAQSLKNAEESLVMVDDTILYLSNELETRGKNVEELYKKLNELGLTLINGGYSKELIEKHPEYLKIQSEINNEILLQQKIQTDLNNFKNLQIILNYQKQDLEYKTNASLMNDFKQNSVFLSILNSDGTINQEILNNINAYRKEHNLVEITSIEEFNLIFGETTEEEWLQRAALSFDVFNSVNPLMVANAVNKNNYEVGVDMDNYLLADNYLTEEEKQTYNYYYNTGGRLKADEYLNFKLGELSNRKQAEEARIHQEEYDNYLRLGKNSNYDELSMKYYDQTLNLPEYLTNEEKNTAIYLYKTEGLNKYDEFIEFLDIDLKQREAKIEAEEAIEDFVNSGIFKGIKIGTTGFSDGVVNFFEGLKNATIIGADGEVSVNQLKSQYILEALMTDSRFMPYIDSGTYEISMGIGNMAPSMAASALVTSLTANPALGAKVGTTLMGVSSGGNSYENALMSGATQSQALLYGILSGSSEATLGYFLGNIPGLSKESSSTLLGLLKEGTEEASQEILDSILRNQVYGEELVLDWDYIKNVGKSGIYGLITSGVLNGGSILYNGAKLKISDVQAALNNLENDLNFDESFLDSDIKQVLDTVVFSETKNEALGELEEYFGEAGEDIRKWLVIKNKTIEQIMKKLPDSKKKEFQNYLQNTRNGRWLSSLTSEEIGAIYKYTKKPEINKWLRIGNLSTTAQKQRQLIDSAIEKSGGLESPTLLYRALNISSFKKNSDFSPLFRNINQYDLDATYETLKLLEGKTMDDLSYLSTSPSYGLSFAKDDEYPIVLEILAEKGTKGAYINQISAYHNFENEFLLARETGLKIENVYFVENDIHGYPKIMVQCSVAK